MLRKADDPREVEPSAFSFSFLRPLPLSSMVGVRDNESPVRDGIIEEIFDMYGTPFPKLFDLEGPALIDGGRESVLTALRMR